MTLSRSEIASGTTAELTDFADLLETLDEEAWRTPTRCEGWRVADVAAHLVGSVTDVVEGRLDGLGTPEVTDREVQERAGRSAGDLAQELATSGKAAAEILATFDDAAWESPAPGGYQGTLGQGVQAIWSDAWQHADDIRAALGRAPVAGPGQRATLHHIAEHLELQHWGPATLAFDGEELPVGGGGRRISGDPHAFILAATGRADPAPLGLDDSVNIYA